QEFLNSLLGAARRRGGIGARQDNGLKVDALVSVAVENSPGQGFTRKGAGSLSGVLRRLCYASHRNAMPRRQAGQPDRVALVSEISGNAMPDVGASGCRSLRRTRLTFNVHASDIGCG